MKTKRGIFSVAVLTALLAMLLAVMPANAQDATERPDLVLPTTFYGSVTVNGAPAPVGTVVTGKLVNPVGRPGSGSITVKTAGQYGEPGLGDSLQIITDKNSDREQPIEFFIKLPGWASAIKADQTAEFNSLSNKLDLTASGSGGSSGGGFDGDTGSVVYVDFFGESNVFSLDPNNKSIDDFTIGTSDGKASLTIADGTTCTKDGYPINSIETTLNENPPEPPEDAYIVAAFNFEPSGAVFNPAITLVYSYAGMVLPEGVAESDLTLAFYDETSGEWVILPCTVNTADQTITAQISHFTIFGVIGSQSAAFTVSGLEISPSSVEEDGKVTISAIVTNTGSVSGSYTMMLNINGVKDQEKTVTVSAGSSQKVTFEVTKPVGDYTVTVDGLTGSFKVTAKAVPTTEPPSSTTPAQTTTPPSTPSEVEDSSNWALIGGVIGAVVVIGILIVVLVIRRRAK